jgi:hypothetical protein
MTKRQIRNILIVHSMLREAIHQADHMRRSPDPNMQVTGNNLIGRITERLDEIDHAVASSK